MENNTYKKQKKKKRKRKNTYERIQKKILQTIC